MRRVSRNCCGHLVRQRIALCLHFRKLAAAMNAIELRDRPSKKSDVKGPKVEIEAGQVRIAKNGLVDQRRQSGLGNDRSVEKILKPRTPGLLGSPGFHGNRIYRLYRPIERLPR